MGIKCKDCDKEFMDIKSLDQHSKAKHSQEEHVSDKILKRRELKKIRKQEKASVRSVERRNKFLKYGVVVLVIALIGYGIFSFSPTGNSVSNPDVPSQPVHWHPTLEIKINGETQIIPANVGIGYRAHQPIHTHKEDNLQGVLHIENNNPTEENMKLGFFFRVWGKTFNSECIFEYCNNEENSIKMFVNGEPNFEFEDYIMKEDDTIVIEYSADRPESPQPEVK